MTISPIDMGQTGSPQAARVPKQTMDGEVFLHLLVTQLSNQDPSAPMDTNDMIAQTTQLASMERLTALADTQDAALAVQQRSAAAALVGRLAETDAATGIAGLVTAVSFAGDEPLVTIGGLQVPYSQIVAVRDASAPVSDAPNAPVDPVAPDAPVEPAPGAADTPPLTA
ncbi:flagellar hook assembly protein FlgD [Arthrobacter halodurans]|uniref:Flagellar hook assembly protein FlgD n=1 Tax=Arthrobacter halodurans TaxID=516699 RepID=A0ABV4UQ53_9MICC